MNRVSRFVFLLFFPFHATRSIETTLCRSCAPTAPLKNNDFRIYCVLISSLLPRLPLVFSSRRGSQSNACARQTLCAFSFFFFFINFGFIADYIPLSFERKRIIVRSTKILSPRSLFSSHLFPKRHFEAYYSVNLHPRNSTSSELNQKFYQ